MFKLDRTGDMDPMHPLAGDRCCVCGRRVFGEHNNIKDHYCAKCFNEWADDIKQKLEWVRELYKQENARRKRRNRRWKAKYGENYLTEAHMNTLTG